VIGAALGLELKGLVRSPLRLVVVVVVLAVGAFVIAQGQRDVTRWNEAIAEGVAQQEESLAEARASFAADRLGPEDRPWVDLSRPTWQDRYAAVRLVREPASLAGIASASAEAGAVAIALSRFADPLLAQGSELENPELATSGGLDLVAVLALLLPLLVLALGVEVGGYERASGLLPLVRVQSGSDRNWIRARCLAVSIVGWLVGLALVAAACLAGSADLGSALAFAALVTAYTGLWTAVLMAVALVARHPSQGAVALGGIWILACVVVPAIGAARSATLAADDYAVDLTVEARDAGQALRALETEAALTEALRRFPALEDSVPEDREAASRAAREAVRVLGLEDRLSRREERALAQAGVVEQTSYLSPSVAFTHALEQLAGRGQGRVRAHRRTVLDAAAARTEWFIAASWSSEPLGSEDFEQLVAGTPTRMDLQADPPWVELALLLAWTLAFVAAGEGLAPLSKRPARGAARTPLAVTT